MDHKGSVSLLIFSIGYLMGVVAHTPTTGIPQIQTWLHHMVPLKNWTEIQGRTIECNLLYSPVSHCSQNPQSSHNVAGILSSRWTHYTFNLWSVSHQTWSCHNNHSKKPWHIHHLPCVGPQEKTCKTSRPLLDIFGTSKVQALGFLWKPTVMIKFYPYLITIQNPNPLHIC